ncbi:MAG TPA: ribosomal protein S18-alanine N-acetyltransferase [Clostridia bacterium]|nr:ribosomal protein S18-alanine N-acetyltransferase [Clostridia bacterium]
MTEDRSAVEIVPMRPEHLEKLAEVERLCFSEPWTVQGLAEEIENPLAVFLVAELDGVTVGYAGMYHVLDEGYLTNVAVDPGFRRRGAARALLDWLDGYAQKKSLQFITLEARVSNRPAIALYHASGYREQGIRPGFYANPREDAVIMTKFYDSTK